MRYLATTMPTTAHVFGQFADARGLLTGITLVVDVLLLLTSFGFLIRILIRRIRRASTRKKTANQSAVGSSAVGVPRQAPRAADPSRRATRVFSGVYFVVSIVGTFLCFLSRPPWSIVGGALVLLALLSFIVFVSRDKTRH
jgi:hypothetical protein